MDMKPARLPGDAADAADALAPTPRRARRMPEALSAA
jgi:hypothetical protein